MHTKRSAQCSGYSKHSINVSFIGLPCISQIRLNYAVIRSNLRHPSRQSIELFLDLVESLKESILYWNQADKGDGTVTLPVTIEKGSETAVKQELALRASAGK